MIGSDPGAGRSSTGAQSMVMPSAAKSSAISRAPRKGAAVVLLSAARPAAGGYPGKCGAFRRATRPPSWSISTGASSRRTASRSPATSFFTCAGFSQLRANKMKPSGSALRKNFFSSSVSAVPPAPKMTARGSRLDEDAGDIALLEGVAAARGRCLVRDRPGHDAEEHAAIGAEIDPHRIGGKIAENVGLRRLELGPVLLRRLGRG